MELDQDLAIKPFKTEYQLQAKNLILAGLEEHWGSLDPNMNPDLNDISANYAEGVFLVGLINRELIATGAIVPRPGNSGEIVRMSVAKNFRRKGIGRMMLEELCVYAKEKGWKKITLETTETWGEAIGFYQRYGFQITHYREGDVYFSMDL